MKKIISLILVLFLLVTTISVNADLNRRVLNELDNNQVLALDEDRLNLNSNFIGVSYSEDFEDIIFSFDLDDYRANEEEGIYYRLRRNFQTSIKTDVIINCLIQARNNLYCFNRYINNNEVVTVLMDGEEEEVSPVLRQLNEERLSVRNRVRDFQREINRDRRLLDGFFRGINLNLLEV